MLANHSRIHTFPETGVFLKALGMRGRELPWTRLGLTLGKERKVLGQLRAQSDLPEEEQPSLPPRRIRLNRSVADTVDFLDRMALAHGTDTWVEKTPRHVLHAGRIQEMVPDSLCIHVVRDGRDVVASIVDRARKFPDFFSRQLKPDYAIRQWNNSIRATLEVLNQEGHLVVHYDSLAHEPEKILQKVCRIAKFPYEEEMVKNPRSLPFVGNQEFWKSNVEEKIEPSPSKFPNLFDTTTQKRIEKSLSLKAFDSLKENL